MTGWGKRMPPFCQQNSFVRLPCTTPAAYIYLQLFIELLLTDNWQLKAVGSLFMKIFLGILALVLVAATVFADYKWRQWMAARRRDRQ